jgi:hypothetical protein
MSHFSEFNVKGITDKATLIRALELIGFEGKVEVYDTPQPLYGYQGDVRAQKANIIIRRKHVGNASNDIGFQRLPDGTYKALISDYDKVKYNTAWLDKLKTAYSVERISKVAKSKGFTVKQEVEKNKVKLVLQRW